MLPLADALLSLAILLLAALVQGFFGFGFGIVAMAGLTLGHDLVHASGLVNITAVVVMGWLTLQLRRQILRGLVVRMLAPMLLGVFLGVIALGRVDRDLMVSILGASIVIVAAWNLVQPRLRRRESPWLDSIMAMLGGLLSGAFNTGGPPLIIHLYRRPEHPEVIKATLQSLLLIMILSRLPMAAAHGLLSIRIWTEAALMLPVVAVGVGAGIALARRVSPERFRRACWLALGLLGVVLLTAG
jgi:uncharacterized membrane protein YfcA